MYRRRSSIGHCDRCGAANILATVMFAGLMLVCTAPASAQDNVTEMNRLNEEGFIEFRAGRYAKAAEHFRDAYEASPDPNLKKNEAIAWFKAGRCDEAVPVANTFLMAPNSAEADRLEARSIIANCRVEMARDAIGTANFDLARSLLDEAESMQPDQYALDQIAIARVELADAKSSGVAGKSGGKSSALGWVMVGTGAAIVGGTAVYWLLTISDRADSRTLSPSDPEYDSVAKRARTSRWLVPLGVIGGAALTGVGVYFVVAGGGDGGTGATAGVTYRW